MDQPSDSKYLASLFWVLILAAPLPGLYVYLQWISDLEQYGYVYPLFLALISLILFRWDFTPRLPSHPVSLTLLAFAILTLSLASHRTSPWFSAVAFALLASSWLHSHLASSEDRHRLIYLALLLVMLIRLPLNLDLQFAAQLQRITSSVSSFLLDAFGVTHYLRGNVIELPGGTLFVEEACSGVQSLFTVLFLVCLWIVFRRRALIATPVYLLFGIGWAMVMNVVRITAIALSMEWYKVDLSSGLPHEILGWICLALAIVMMLSSDRLIRVLFFPIPPDESGSIADPCSRLFNRALSWGVPQQIETKSPQVQQRLRTGRMPEFFARGLLTVAILVCVPSIASGFRMVSSRLTLASADDRPLLWEPRSELLEKTQYHSLVANHHSLRNANSRQLGNHADVWTVLLDGIPVRLAVSQPYPEWHDMRLCYNGNGWQVNEWNPTIETIMGKAESDAYQQWPVSHAELVQDSGEFGTLLFSGMTQSKELLTPPMSGLISLFDDRVKDRSGLQSDIIMLQLWTETQKPVLPEQLAKLDALFRSFRNAVLEDLDAVLRPSVAMTPTQGGPQ